MNRIFVKMENVCSNKYGSRQKKVGFWKISDLGRIILSILGKKCYFYDVITAALLFQRLRFQGVSPPPPKYIVTMGCEERLKRYIVSNHRNRLWYTCTFL